MRRLEQYADMDKEMLSKVDMTGIYDIAGVMCGLKNIKCPTILISHKRPVTISRSDGDGHQILVLNSNRTVREGVNEVINWILAKNEEHIELKEGEEKGNDMTVAYSYSAAMATSLGIRCPLILDRDLVDERETKAFLKSTFNKDGRVAYTVLKSTWSQDMMLTFYALALEMSHVWQDEKHYNKFFLNKKELRDCKTFEEYLMRDVEIDAAAYACRVMWDIFGVDALEAGYAHNNDNFKQAVKEKAKKLYPKYSQALMLMGVCFARG